MADQHPDISVILSVKDGEPYIAEAVQSLLDQTYTNFELILIDDGSKDTTLQTLKSFESDERVKVVPNPVNLGLPKSLNKAISLAKADIVARMDGDDISAPDRFEKQYRFLQQNPDYVVVGCQAVSIDENGEDIFQHKLPSTWEEVQAHLPKSPMVHGSAMIRKAALEEIGGYHEQMIRAQDRVLFNKLAKVGKIANLPEALYKLRVIPTQATTYSVEHQGIIDRICTKAINGEELNDTDMEEMRSISTKLDPQVKKYHYHMFLARKYLFDNYKPKKVRSNITSALAIKPFSPIGYALYVASLLPKSILSDVYRKFKG